ncbi:MAG: rod shape-determining protein MreC [Gammaproteobacteria bacterium]|nr:rod shape-determining protein MreC [Gammaproteobacteria bacterium]
MPSLRDPDARPLLLRGPSLGLRFIVLAALSVGIMVADHRQQHLTTVRAALTAAAYPLQWLVNAPFEAAGWLGESTATRASLRAENVVLASENLKLRLRMMRFEALEHENERLRAGIGSTARVVQRSLIAEILRVDLDPYRQRVLVNRGSRDGIYVGQAALDANGVFGQVTRVGPWSAEIILIADSRAAVPVLVERNGLRTVASGSGQSGQLILPYLPKSADIKPGDLLLSSGLGGVFPPGYPVARVAAVERNPSQPLLSVTAAPLAALDRAPEVLLVWFDSRVPEPVAEPASPAAPAAAEARP